MPEAAHPGAFPPDVAKGMTLLDYFAAKAMQGMLSNAKFPDKSGVIDGDKVAVYAYVMAEAMLAERNRRNPWWNARVPAAPDYRAMAERLADSIRIAEEVGLLPRVVEGGPLISAVHGRAADYLREALAAYRKDHGHD